MKTLKLLTGILYFFIISSIANGQTKSTDESLLVDKWKFVQLTKGSLDNKAEYNGQPILIFEKNGRWVTEDTNPYYQQSGTWEIKGDSLIRDPAKKQGKDHPSYSRKIEKLTEKEFIISADSYNGGRGFIWHFAKMK